VLDRVAQLGRLYEDKILRPELGAGLVVSAASPTRFRERAGFSTVNAAKFSHWYRENWVDSVPSRTVAQEILSRRTVT